MISMSGWEGCYVFLIAWTKLVHNWCSLSTLCLGATKILGILDTAGLPPLSINVSKSIERTEVSLVAWANMTVKYFHTAK